MKVLHFGTFDYNAGGPAMSSYLTLKGLREQGVDVEIAMYPLSPNGHLRGEDVLVNYCKAPLDGKFIYSPVLKRELKSVPNVDIYHTQGIWQYPTYAIVDVARSKGRPYLITPRGMLYPQDIAKANTFFKRLSLKIRLLRDLNRAACVQVTCEEEMQHCRNLGVTSPIAIIPNPVEIKEYLPQTLDGVFRIGYMGRISRRKNVEALIYAMDHLKLENSELLIIGSGDKEYEAFLHSETDRLSLKNVKFAGFLFGKDKDKALSTVSLLVMPSEFENLGNVILEGLVRGIPCIATKGAPWKDLEDNHCGWWVDYDQQAIEYAIATASKLSQDELHQMGKNGKQLMKVKYSVESVARNMTKLYSWILDKEVCPSFVYFKK